MDSSDDERRTPRRAASPCWGTPTTSPSRTPTRHRVSVLCTLHRVLYTALQASGWSITEDRGVVFRARSALQDPPDLFAEQGPGPENNEDTNGE
jgi:hypothetical protein